MCILSLLTDCVYTHPSTSFSLEHTTTYAATNLLLNDSAGFGGWHLQAEALILK